MVIDSALRWTQATRDLVQGLGRIDRAAAHQRVANTKARQPGLSREALHRQLTLSKCMQVAVVSGLGGGAGLLPGRGLIGRALLGPLAETSLVTMLQAELIIETFALYELELPLEAERLAVAALAGAHAGTRHAGIESARAVALGLQRVLGNGLTRAALPLAEVLTTSLSQVALTYAIGMRAQTVARLPRARAMAWPDIVRQFVSFDERGLVEWTTGAARDALTVANQVASFWLGQVRERVGPFAVAPAGRPPAKVKPASKRAAKKSTVAAKRAATAR